MSSRDLVQVLIFFALLVAFTPPLGAFMAKLAEGKRTFLHPILGWLEKLCYKLSGVNPEVEMDWKGYSKATFAFSLVCLVAGVAALMFQSHLPLNPTGLPNLSWHLAFNTAVSFGTNTNWQSYGGESTMSRFNQMAVLAVQNFVSAAVGIAVVFAMIRGLRNKASKSLGNFWADITRVTVYLLLPLSLIFALVLVQQGVPQTHAADLKVKTVEGADQVIALGPVASQIVIKNLGTNGGGYYNANAAHPYENPTPWSDTLEVLAIILISSSLCWTYGLMVGNRKAGVALWAAMTILFTASLATAFWAEYQPNPAQGEHRAMEGKETRLGVGKSATWAVVTTVASCGAVNSMHDSLRPLTGLMALNNMLIGEIVYGGVGSGLYGMLAFVILTVFMAGLMVGRGPEVLGKKIEAVEVKLVVVALLVPGACALIGASIAVLIPQGLSSLNNLGPHGLTEIFYAFASCSANNGSAFAGLNANTPFYDTSLGLVMLFSRFIPIFAVLGIAGTMSMKRISPQSAGTFATDTPIFVALLVSIILIVAVLIHMPAYSLGPIVEHFLMAQGRLF